MDQNIPVTIWRVLGQYPAQMVSTFGHISYTLISVLYLTKDTEVEVPVRVGGTFSVDEITTIAWTHWCFIPNSPSSVQRLFCCKPHGLMTQKKSQKLKDKADTQSTCFAYITRIDRHGKRSPISTADWSMWVILWIPTAHGNKLLVEARILRLLLTVKANVLFKILNSYPHPDLCLEQAHQTSSQEDSRIAPRKATICLRTGVKNLYWKARPVPLTTNMYEEV